MGGKRKAVEEEPKAPPARRKKPEHDPVDEVTVEGMTVTKIGRGMYICDSTSQLGVKYQVDIMENDGLGNCQCADFAFRKYPRWKSAKTNLDSFRCRHIRRVRNHVMDQIIRYYILQEQEGNRQR